MRAHSAAAPQRQETTADLFGFSGEVRRYPDIPGYKGAPGGPSAQAAEAIAATVTGRRGEVLDFLRKRAAEPMTADQIAAQLGRTPFGIRPRVTELHKLGLIEPAPTRGVNESGMSAHRWRAVERGSHHGQ